MSSSTSYSARESMLGYDYQKVYALHILATSHKPDVSVAIELLDDVDLENSKNSQLLQLKRKANILTDLSSDLWKTLGIWSDLLGRNEIDKDTRLIMATTGSLPSQPDAIAVLLSEESKSVKQIVDRLDEVAKQSKSKDLKTRIQKYLGLDQTQKETLVKNIRVKAGSPDFAELEEEIKLSLGVLPEHEDQIYQDLRGWWDSRVNFHLRTDTYDRITRREYIKEFNRIRDNYTSENLPIRFAFVDTPDDFDATEYNFIKQLKSIAPNEIRVRHAILDFYRASAERAEWVNGNLLRFSEIENYEKRLMEAWELRFAQLQDDMPSLQDSEEDMKKFGRNLLTWLETGLHASIRAKVDAPHIPRGTYHILANHSSPRIWWHPLFKERIKEILGIEEVPSEAQNLWEMRPVEVANLLNPAFCALLLRDAIGAYEPHNGMPYKLIPLIFPVILQGRIRERLPSTLRTKFTVWIQENQTLKVGFADILEDLMAITKEAFSFATLQEILIMSDDGYVRKVKNKKVASFTNTSSIEKSDAENIRKSAEFIGRWYAKVGDADSVWASWGIRQG